MERSLWRAVVSLATAALVLGAVPSGLGLAAPPGPSKSNPWGLTLVRFAPGTPPDQMRSAVVQAGGEVVTDASALGALSVLPTQKGFASRIKADRRVRAAWEEKVSVRVPRTDSAAQDAGLTGKNAPELGSPGPQGPPDPWHNLASFLGETNPEGILQWDDNRMNVPSAWRTTTGNRTVRVAVLDTGVQGSHKELLPNYDNQTSANTIPCNLLTRQFGPLGEKDCSSEDTSGHGTWVASRIAGAANGFASNGIAPNVQIVGYKVLSTPLGGGLTSWIVAAMIDACSNNVDLINMSLGGYDEPSVAADQEDYLLWVDAVDYCRARGTAIFASAGNDHVRVNRVNMVVGGRSLVGVGQVDRRNEGIASIIPGTPLEGADRRGLLEVPAGVPGVVMVSATNNAIGPAGSDVPAGLRWPAEFTGKRDQLTYYSSYGARVDLAAPGGARKFNIPRSDGGPGDILYGGWGTLGALDGSGEICTDPALASLLTFACFKVSGAGFGWLQGTSMSSPNAAGVAALALAAHPELQGKPDALLTHLKTTARKEMTNYMGPNDPKSTAPSYAGVPCPTAFCHVDFRHPLAFSDAYGAGIVDGGRAVAR